MEHAAARATAPYRIDIALRDRDADAAVRRDAWIGLRRRPKEMPPKWFYDERGSALYDAITRLPEYYLTRKESEILQGRALQVATTTKADTLIEIGSGAAEKTKLLLDGMKRAKTLQRYVPFDVSLEQLRHVAATVSENYPGIQVHAVAGDFERHLSMIPDVGERRLFAFLGSTIGNLKAAARQRFFAELAQQMRPGDHLLMGADLVKDPAIILSAYDDPAGITAAFNKNLLVVLNRRLRANFDLRYFEHAVRWNAERERVEMYLRSKLDQRVCLREINLEVRFARGEEMRTEISNKFRRDGIEAELVDAGLAPRTWWTDQEECYAVMLATR